MKGEQGLFQHKMFAGQETDNVRLGLTDTGALVG